MKIGILGGTFNPVHLGHLRMAEGAMTALGLDQVLWIPARLPPHKPVDGPVSAEHRCRMVELAITGLPAYRVSRIELDRPGPSYTVETLRQLARQEPAAAWYVLVGSDMVPDLPAWKEIGEAMRLATFVAVPRPDAPVAAWPPQIQRLDVPTLPISSSAIRERVRRGQPIDTLVPAAVSRYIAEQSLYR